MFRNRRDRLVIFRLSQAEYQKLKDASERNGARNLSDFTRGEVLKALNSRADGNHVEHTFSSMQQSMAELKATMLRLQSVLEGVNNAKSAAGSEILVAGIDLRLRLLLSAHRVRPDTSRGRRAGDSRGQSSRAGDRRQRPDRCLGIRRAGTGPHGARERRRIRPPSDAQTAGEGAGPDAGRT